MNRRKLLCLSTYGPIDPRIRAAGAVFAIPKFADEPNMLRTELVPPCWFIVRLRKVVLVAAADAPKGLSQETVSHNANCVGPATPGSTRLSKNRATLWCRLPKRFRGTSGARPTGKSAPRTSSKECYRMILKHVDTKEDAAM